MSIASVPPLSSSLASWFAAALWLSASLALVGQTPPAETSSKRVLAKCTVILQTRPNRLYCYATNAPFRVILREPARFTHGEVFIAEGELAPEPIVETIPTLLDSTVERTGEIQLPPPRVLTPAQLATNGMNFHRVALWGRVVSHEWMKFLDHHLEVIVAQGVDRTFRINLMEFCDAANKLPPGTEVEFVGLSFVETFAESRGPEAQIDMENLDECRVLKSAPWITPRWARRMPAIGGAAALLVAVWVARERRQIRRLRTAERTVRELNTGLEQRIAERTAELQAANDRLRQAEQDLLRTLATEKELNQLKTRFVSMVSHELRNPLGIVMCSTEVLKHYLEDLPESERESHLNAIHEASRRMSNLMEEVLFLGRLEVGRMQCALAPLDLDCLSRRVAHETTLATAGNATVNVVAKDDLGGAIGDESLIRHILSNLISNALKYSPTDRPVQVELSRSGPNAILVVTDRGIGIGLADQPRIFEGFFRGANVGTTGGSGIGLSIVRRCVELHRGTIHFESREGEGSRFEVRLPLFEAPQQPPLKPVFPNSIA